MKLSFTRIQVILYLACLASLATAQVDETVGVKKQVSQPGSIFISVGPAFRHLVNTGFSGEAGYFYRFNPRLSLGVSGHLSQLKPDAVDFKITPKVLFLNTKIDLIKVTDDSRFTIFILGSPLFGSLHTDINQKLFGIRPGLGLEFISKSSKFSFHASASNLITNSVVIELDQDFGGRLDESLKMVLVNFGIRFKI